MPQQTTLKRSRQRDAIVTFLKSRKDHPTADVIYSEMRKRMSNISLGTVYRNLTLLSNRGEILRLSCDGKADRFDANTSPHYHFICKECGGVQDMTLPYDDHMDEMASSRFEGRITGHTLTFEGVCVNCSHKKSPL